MNTRTAKKITRRIEANPTLCQGYTPRQAQRAFVLRGDPNSQALITWKANRSVRSEPVPVQAETPAVDLPTTVTGLKALCKERNLTGYSRLKKVELIELLNAPS